MANHCFILVFCALFCSHTISSAFQIIRGRTSFVEGRDNWYEQPPYDDLPRYFNPHSEFPDGCRENDFYLKCSKCTCPNGIVQCDIEICSTPPQIVNWENGKSCPAGEPFFYKCNDCQCDFNGHEASCTNRVCPRPN